jgi:hypothetical protein
LVLLCLAIYQLIVHDCWTQTGRPFSPYYHGLWGDCNQWGMDRFLTVVGVKGVDQGDSGRWFGRVIMVFVVGFPPCFEYSSCWTKIKSRAPLFTSATSV